MNTEREASMARHPAGKGRPIGEAPVKVVYSTATGEEPKGGPTSTDEATVLPMPVKKITKPRVKKATPRHRPKRGSLSELHTNIKVDPRVWKEAQRLLRESDRYLTKIDIIDAETVIVR